MSELSKVLKAAQERDDRGWSTREIAANMDELGHSVSYSTVALYLKGKHGTPEEATLQAFAAVFPELSIGLLRDLAHLPPGEKSPYVPPTATNRLSRTQRQALDAVIAAMLETQATDATVHQLHDAVRELERLERENEQLHRGRLSHLPSSVPLAADDSPDESSEVEAQQDEP